MKYRMINTHWVWGTDSIARCTLVKSIWKRTCRESAREGSARQKDQRWHLIDLLSAFKISLFICWTLQRPCPKKFSWTPRTTVWASSPSLCCTSSTSGAAFSRAPKKLLSLKFTETFPRRSNKFAMREKPLRSLAAKCETSVTKSAFN